MLKPTSLAVETRVADESFGDDQCVRKRNLCYYNKSRHGKIKKVSVLPRLFEAAYNIFSMSTRSTFAEICSAVCCRVQNVYHRSTFIASIRTMQTLRLLLRIA